MNTYIYIYTHVHTYTCIYIYTCTYIYVYIYTTRLILHVIKPIINHPSSQARQTLQGHQDLSCTMVFGKKPVEWDKAKMGLSWRSTMKNMDFTMKHGDLTEATIKNRYIDVYMVYCWFMINQL